MHYRTFLATALAALLGGLASLRAATPINRLAGADTVFLITLDDVGALHKNWQQSPAGRTWNDPQMVRFLAPLREAMKIDEWDERCRSETGKGIDELAAGFGSMMLAVPDFSATLADETGKTPPAVLLAVELRDNRDVVLKLIEKEREKKRGSEMTEEFQGETLHLETPDAGSGSPEVCWVVTGDVLLLSPDKRCVQKAVADYKRGGAESPYVETDRFKGEVKRLPDAQIRIHLDVDHLMPLVKAAIARESAKKKPNSGPAPEDVINALGLDSLRTVTLAGRIGETESLATFSITYDRLHGLARLFSCYGGAPAPEPTFLSGEWAAVASGRFRLAELYSVVEETVHGFGPTVDAVFQGWVGNLNKNAGLDLKRDLFGNFGDEIYVARRFDDAGAGGPMPQNHQLMVFSIRDDKALAGALEATMTALMGPGAAQLFQSREYLGTTIHSMVGRRPPNARPDVVAKPAFSYACTARYFIVGIGGEDLVESTIQNLRSPQPSYWSRPEIKSALAKLPDGAMGYSYTDLPKLVPVYLNLVTQAVQVGGMRVKDGRLQFGAAPPRAPHKKGGPASLDPPDEPPEDAGKLPVDLTQKPAPDSIARYWGPFVSANYQDSTGFYTVMRMDHPQ